jgi:hypothetical protein
MEKDLVDLLRPRLSRKRREAQPELTTCTLCLRVLRGKQWLQAEVVIRELRSYDQAAPPRLRSAICDDCAESILSRRADENEPVAA